MQRKYLSFLILSLLTLFPMSLFAAEASSLLSEENLNRLGLKRSWFNQVNSGGNVAYILHIEYDRDMLFLVTSDARIMAVNAEIGSILWTRSIGQPGQGTFKPSANMHVVGVINGVDLYVLDRRNGHLLWKEQMPAPPTAACKVTDFYVYVPLIDNRLVSYPIREQPAPSAELMELVPAYEKLGYHLNPFTGKVTKVKQMTFAEEEKIAEVKNVLDRALHEEEERQSQLNKSGLSKNQIVDELSMEDNDNDRPYYLQQQKTLPKYVYSFGMVVNQPIVANQTAYKESIAWFSDKGYLFVGFGDRQHDHLFLLHHKVTIAPSLSYLRPTKVGKRYGNIARDIVYTPGVIQQNPEDADSKCLIIIGTTSGLVLAYDPIQASNLWVQSLGAPVDNRLAVVKDRIYVPCFDGYLYCLDAADGKPIWKSADIREFVAASPTRVYARNHSDELVALDPMTGAQTTLFSLRPYAQVLFNEYNDRLFLLTKSGMIQCLHEMEFDKPVLHRYLPEAYFDFVTKDDNDLIVKSGTATTAETTTSRITTPTPTPSSSQNITKPNLPDDFGDKTDVPGTTTTPVPATPTDNTLNGSNSFDDADYF